MRKPFWIKRRHNPQLGVYHVAMGRLSLKSARVHEHPLYGDNEMIRFDDENAYNQRLKELKEEGSLSH